MLKKTKITWKSLLSSPYYFKACHKTPLIHKKTSVLSFPNRFPTHNNFLKKQRNEIKVFADIGCALSEGAPTTIEAKKALGEKSTVLAVDLEENFSRIAANALEKKGITAIKQSISEKPLKQKCDAIRFANVAIWMTESERRRAILNIWKSLREGGYLLGATVAPKSIFILKKTRKGFELVKKTKN